MFLRFIWCVIFLNGIMFVSFGQIVINEVVSSNNSGITDEDKEFIDWIELYNSSDSSVNLEGYIIKDKLVDSVGWTFPKVNVAAGSHLLVLASGKDRKNVSLHYKTIIQQGDEWQYVVPVNSIAGDWRLPDFDASGWAKGISGFGYGDNDDGTVLNGISSVYIRKEFMLANTEEIQKIIIHVDYDDGFIASINGTDLIVENVTLGSGGYDDVVSVAQHEALMYLGQSPTAYTLDVPAGLLREGKNVFTLQGYNNVATSSDLTLIPYLTFGSTAFSINEIPDFISIQEGNLHTNFKIDNKGESLYLFNSNNQLIDSVAVVKLPADVSYGRFEDGMPEWFYYIAPTPGNENLNPVSELRNDSILFSVSSGFYPTVFYLKLTTTTPNGKIRYTTDGSEPTINSNLLSDSLFVGSTRVIRGASFLDNVIASEVFSATYFINDRHDLPVISIATDPKNLYDYNEGILVDGPNAQANDPHFGANYWMDWEKVVNLEFFDEHGDEKLNQGAGLSITGAWSRAKPQKSLALFARKEYGKGSFEYPLFKDREFEKYESFMLRNSGNDWESTMLRDGFTSEIAKKFNVDRLAFQPTIVYLNGDYWGILNMRERPNNNYFEAHYGVKEENLNLLEVEGNPINGSNNSYVYLVSLLNQQNTLVSEEAYQKVISQIDVDCFIDYELLEIFANNTDWPGNNIKFWRSNEQKSKWRWILYDTDFGYSLYSTNGAAENGIRFATAANGPSWPNPPWSTLLLRRLLTNESFKYQFVNRMADCLNTDFTPTMLSEKLDSLSSNIESEIGHHQEVWGRNYDYWTTSLDRMKNFITQRQKYTHNQFMTYFSLAKLCSVHLAVSGEQEGSIQVNTLTPVKFPFIGRYFSNVPVPFKALPKPGYRFVRWENASTSINSNLQLTLTGDITLRAVFEKASDDDLNVMINEINYNSDSTYNSGDWIELYNSGEETMDMSGWVLADAAVSNSFTFPSGTILYPNSYLVICEDNKNFGRIYPEVKNFQGNFKFGLGSGGDVITLTDSSNNMIDYVMYETAEPWPTEPLISAATLQLINPVGDNTEPQSWSAGPTGGTPGARNFGITAVDLGVDTGHKITCFPNCFSDYTTLRVYNSGGKGYSITILDIQGRTLYSNSGKFDGSGTYYIDLFADGNNYMKGIYLVKVKTNLGTQTLKVVKQ